MAIVSVSATWANIKKYRGTHTMEVRYNGSTTSSCKIMPANIFFVDSASTVTWVGRNAAVTSGTKYLYWMNYSNAQRYGFIIAEATNNGTTAASIPSQAALDPAQWRLGATFTDGTATFKIRYPTSWNMAINPGVAAPSFGLAAPTGWGILRYLYQWDTSFQNSRYAYPWNPFCALLPFTVYFASTSSSTIADGYAFPQADSTTWFSFSNPTTTYHYPSLQTHPDGNVFISCNKAAYPPTTYAAGAVVYTADTSTAWSSGNGFGYGWMRGLVLGEATATTTLRPVNVGMWHALDCTFQNNVAALDGTANQVAIGGGQILSKCTFINNNSTTPAANWGNFYPEIRSDTLIESPTFTRSGSTYTHPYILVGQEDATGIDFSFSTYVVGGSFYDANFNGVAARYNTQSYSTMANVMPQILITGANMKYSGYTIEVPHRASWISNNTSAAVSTGKGAQPRWEGDQTLTAVGPEAFQRQSTYTRSGGATDAGGDFAYQVTLSSSISYLDRLVFYNTKVDEGLKLTLEFEWGGGANVLRTEDVWLEVVYLDHTLYNSMSMAFSFDKRDRRALVYNNANTPVACATSSATWAGGLANAVKQKATVEFNPRKAGPVYVYVGYWLSPYTANALGHSGTTVYICPRITIAAAD